MTALVDPSGGALELEHPARRIVLLIPSTTETLCRPDQARELMREEWAFLPEEGRVSVGRVFGRTAPGEGQSGWAVAAA